MRNQYIDTRPKPKRDFREPPKGPSKRAVRMIIILLFLTALILFLFPGAKRTPEPGTRAGVTDGRAYTRAPADAFPYATWA